MSTADDKKIATFRSDYECQIEYEYNFQISNQLCFQNRRRSLLLINRKGGSRNNIGVTIFHLQGCEQDLKSRTHTQSRTRTPIWRS